MWSQAMQTTMACDLRIPRHESLRRGRSVTAEVAVDDSRSLTLTISAAELQTPGGGIVASPRHRERRAHTATVQAYLMCRPRRRELLKWCCDCDGPGVDCRCDAPQGEYDRRAVCRLQAYGRFGVLEAGGAHESLAG